MKIVTEKFCKKCKKVKASIYFNIENRHRDGLRTNCKECEVLVSKKWAQDNYEHRKDYRKIYNQEHKIQNANNSRNWRKNNKEKSVRISSKWQKKNPDKVYAIHRNYRAKSKYNGGKITTDEWITLKKKYNYTCLCCNKKEPEITLHLDHVIPISKGGSNIISNAQPLCKSCNSKKHNKFTDYR